MFGKNKNSEQNQVSTNIPDTAVKTAPVKKKRHIFRNLIIAALVISAGFGVYKLFFTEEKAEILTSFTKYYSVSMQISGSGTTTPKNLQAITVASRAEITDVYVSQGDAVKAGDLLYKQDDSEIDEIIGGYKDDITEQQERIDEYEDSIGDCKEQLEEATENLAKLNIYAPFSGHLISISAEDGDDVRDGTQLATLVDDGTMILKQYFPYIYRDKLYVGMESKISVPSLMNVYDGQITDIKDVEYITSEGTKCFLVAMSVSNPGAFTDNTEAEGYISLSDRTSIYPVSGATLKYNDTKIIKAEADGILRGLSYSDYQYIESRTLLATIESDTYSDRIANLKKMIERYNGYIDNCRERIATLRENIADAEESREDYAVKAEIDGTIIACTLEKGDKPMSNQVAVLLYNLDVMTVSVQFDEYDADYIKKGMDVKVVRTTNSGGSVFDGTISELSLEGTSSGSVSYFDATIEINSQGELASGVSVSYYITVGDEEEGVLVPIAALQNTSEGYCVFVKSDTKPENAIDIEGADIPEGFYAVKMKTGTSTADYVRALSGIDENVEVFVGYKQKAPTWGNSKSENADADSSNNSQSQNPSNFGNMSMPNGGFTPGGGGNFRGNR